MNNEELIGAIYLLVSITILCIGCLLALIHMTKKEEAKKAYLNSLTKEEKEIIEKYNNITYVKWRNKEKKK